MIDQLLQYDTELFLFLNTLGTPTWDGFWMFYTTKFNWIPFYAVLLFLIYKKRADKRFLITVVIVVLMVTFTDQITNMFKRGFERPRPCYNLDIVGLMRRVKPNCGGAFGYFSGHASNSMAAAFFVGLTLRYKYKYFIYFMIFWAMLMGYSRIYVGVHYPLDVFSGMVFGAFMGVLFSKLESYLQNNFGSKFKPSV